MFVASETAAGRPNACSECGKSFCYGSVLLRHERALSGDRCSRCLDCGILAPRPPSCMCTASPTVTRLSTSAGSAARASATAAASTCTKACTSGFAAPAPAASAVARFPHRPALLLHRRSSHLPEQPRHCPLCARAFRQSSLRFHQAWAHPRDIPTSSLNCCAQCPRAFHSSTGLRSHVRVHSAHSPGDSTPWKPHGPDTHPCGVCDKSFGKSSTLTRHLQTHWSEKPFKCPECGKGFLETDVEARVWLLWARLQLELHVAVPPSQPPGSAAACLCHLWQGLRTLLRPGGARAIHMDERPFPCPECSRRFSDRLDLIKPRRTHTGEKPYCCELCGKRFTCVSNLNVYRCNHAGHKPHKCPQCGKAFSVGSKLALYRKTHLGKQTAQCGFSHSCSCVCHTHARAAATQATAAATLIFTGQAG